MKALIISLQFPPILGMASRRMAYCANALASAGHEVEVLTVEPEENHPVYWVDLAEMKLVEKKVKVHRISMGLINRLAARISVGGRKTFNFDSTNGRNGGAIRRLGSKLYKSRSFWQPFAMPDASVDWLLGAVPRARSLIKEKNYDLVVTHGNPNTCHLVAYYSLGKRKARLVSDYGDAWGTNPILQALPNWRKRIDRYLERKFLSRVDAITTSSEGIARGLQFQYGVDRSKISVVPSCFVSIEEYKAIQARPSPRFNLAYTGNIHHGIQDSLPFLRALKKFEAKDLQVSIAGQVTEEFVRFVESNLLEDIVKFKGQLNRAEVMQLQRSASALLLFGIEGGMQIPAKLYEYFAAQRPILCIVYQEDDPAAALVQNHNRGVVAPNNSERISSALRGLIDLHSANQLDSSISFEDLFEYSFTGASEKFLRGILP